MLMLDCGVWIMIGLKSMWEWRPWCYIDYISLMTALTGFLCLYSEIIRLPLGIFPKAQKAILEISLTFLYQALFPDCWIFGLCRLLFV